MNVAIAECRIIVGTLLVQPLLRRSQPMIAFKIMKEYIFNLKEVPLLIMRT